jgi:hypothetical protein
MYVETRELAMKIFAQKKCLIGAYGYFLNPICTKRQNGSISVITVQDMFLHAQREVKQVTRYFTKEKLMEAPTFYGFYIEARTICILAATKLVTACGEYSCDGFHGHPDPSGRKKQDQEGIECFGRLGKVRMFKLAVRLHFKLMEYGDMQELCIQSRSLAQLFADEDFCNHPNEVEHQLSLNEVDAAAVPYTIQEMFDDLLVDGAKLVVSGCMYPRSNDHGHMAPNKIRCASLIIVDSNGSDVKEWKDKLVYKSTLLQDKPIVGEGGET